MRTLRPYQNEAVEASFIAWERGARRILLQAATGSGKSIMLAEVVRRFREKNPGKRVVFLVHRHEILRSCAEAISRQSPSATVGIVDGSVQGKDRDTQAGRDVVCINTATLGVSASQRTSNGKRMNTVNRLHSQLKPVGLVVLDEAHRAVSGTAKDCLEQLGVFEEGGPNLLGCSATPFREDKKDLNDIFEEQVYSIGVVELIEKGALIEPKHLVAMVEGLDLNKVGCSRISTGEVDLNANELDLIMESSGSFGVVAEFVKLHASDRKTLVFVPSIHSADLVADKLNKIGVSAISISGSTSEAVRAKAFNDIQNGDLQCIVNCQIYTEGVDLPIISAVVIARPTRSKTLYKQICGRALRPYPGKTDALIIDLVGATHRNDLATFSDLDDDVDNVNPGETLVEAKARASATATKLSNFTGKVNQILQGELDPEEYKEAVVVSGTFNVWEVDHYSPEQVAKKIVGARAEVKEKKRILNLPSFPSVETFGPWIMIDQTYAMSLKDWTQGRTRGSYVCFMEVKTSNGIEWVVFRKDSTKSFPESHDFVGLPCGTLDEAEKVAMAYGRGNLPSGVWSYNISPQSQTKKAQASFKMMSMMRSRGVQIENLNLVKVKEMRAPTTGVAGNWLAYVDICRDVLKQSESVRRYYNE